MMPQCRWLLVLVHLLLWGAMSTLAAQDPKPNRPKPEIVGHRGASHDAPENTIASVKLAFEQQADAAEIDVYLSRDGKIVAIHDATTKRTAGLDRKVAEQTLAELRTLDAGRWKAAEFRGEPIPTLEDILAVVPKGKRLFIEIKCGPEVLPVLEQTLQATATPSEKVAIIGFSLETMQAARARFPKLAIYWVQSLKEDPETKVWKPSAAELCREAQAAGLDGVDLSDRPGLDAEYVKAIRAHGLEFYTWTVNDPAAAQRLVELGVDGITTDRPGFLREALK